jgi:hypothetical protein
MSPQDLLDKLKENASQKTQDTLDSIYQICIEQQARGIDDFSVSTISRLGYKRGVPKSQSIRNKSGEQYRALIQAFSELNTNKKQIKVPKKDEDWIEEITNPKHKLLVRILASELKAAQKKLSEIIPPNMRINVYDYKNTKAETIKLSEQERRALEYLVSISFQRRWSFKPTEYGELIDANDNPVFKVCTLDAIKKALDYL